MLFKYLGINLTKLFFIKIQNIFNKKVTKWEDTIYLEIGIFNI